MVGIVSFLAKAAIIQTVESPGVSRYVFCHWNTANGQFSPVKESAGLLRSRIDQYEASKQFVKRKYTESPFNHKSYVPFMDGVMAIYSLKEEKSVQFVYFK